MAVFLVFWSIQDNLLIIVRKLPRTCTHTIPAPHKRAEGQGEGLTDCIMPVSLPRGLPGSWLKWKST